MLYIPRYDISMDRFVRQISILQDIRGSRGVGVQIWKIWRPPSPPPRQTQLSSPLPPEKMFWIRAILF